MSLEYALVGYLLRQPEVVALVGSRIEPVRNVQGSVMPAVAYQLISRPQDYSHDGPGLGEPRVQLTISGATFTSVSAVANALRPLLAGKRFTDRDGEYTAFVENEDDGIAPTSGQAGYFVRRMDVVIVC
ncbi:MAG: DUF3168 domain-containing protein [Rhodospirillales bacterium]|nr:DUF3168 domain-containing protein [Rhodospirillales bacterium]